MASSVEDIGERTIPSGRAGIRKRCPHTFGVLEKHISKALYVFTVAFVSPSLSIVRALGTGTRTF
jgi:hypothetical protein